MPDDKEKREIFSESPNKTYGLMAIVKGGSNLIDKEPEDTEFTYPNLIIKEMVAFMFISVVLVIISLLFNAPLEELANPSKTPNPAKAPWYFLGLQELLHYFPPIVAGVIVPTLVVAGLIVLPYIDNNKDGIGEWFSGKRKAAISLFAAFVILVVILTGIGRFFRGPSWSWVWPWESTINENR